MATQNYNSKSQRYMTPKELYQPILDFMGIDKFDSDVACENMNIPARKYFTTEGSYSESDFLDRYTSPNTEDGLTGVWGEGIHFMNPPWRYSKNFLLKAKQEVETHGARVWAILPADRFETKFMQETVLKNLHAFVVFLPKAGFLIPEEPLKPIVPSVKAMLVYLGKDAYETAKSWNDVNANIGVAVYNALNLN